MSLFVKICGLATEQEVAAAVAAGADAIGFVFADSVRRVTPGAAARAATAAPGGVLRVAVMRHPAPADWLAVLDGFRPDVLQTDAADLEVLDVPASIETWPVYREGPAGPRHRSRVPGCTKVRRAVRAGRSTGAVRPATLRAAA